MWGRGAHHLQCKSESAQCSEKTAEPMRREGGGGGLKFEEKNVGKIGHRFPCISYFFIYPQPNSIGPVRFWSGEGRGHS